MMNYGESFEETEYLLSLDEPAQTLKILQRLKVCREDETITEIERAGDGNMNLVMRVVTDQRTVIVKQARPWVEKYPSIAAPVDRILAEAAFYELVSSVPDVAKMMPSIIAADTKRKLLVMEDLGTANDYSSLYSCDDFGEARVRVFEQAAVWLARLHQTKIDRTRQVGCDQLRALNHKHIFSIPLNDPPEIELNSVCPGLEDASRQIRANAELQLAFDRLGEKYLNPSAENATLLHGDYYPGSWLSTQDGFRVIDPEFCFCGPPEFDIGVMASHYIFCSAPPKLDSVQQLVSDYETAAGRQVSLPLVLGFAGAELIRRILGVAQLPLTADLDQRKNWLQLGLDFTGVA